MMPAGARLEIRSYGRAGAPHRHDHPQLVLPLGGRLAIDVAGRRAELGAGRIAFVATGRRHGQAGLSANRSLIVDLPGLPPDSAVLGLLSERPFPRIGAATAALITTLGLAIETAAADPSIVRHGLPRLLDRLARDAEQPPDPLSALLAAIDADPGADWRTARMAARLGLGSSRFHECFVARTGTTPHDRVVTARLRLARTLLTGTTLPIATIAERCGFADQSALTHALRRRCGETPARLRLRARPETGAFDKTDEPAGP